MNLKELNSDIYDFDKILGKLTFLNLRKIAMKKGEEGDLTEVKKKVYNCLSDNSRAVVQVSLPPDVADKVFERGQEVELCNPVLKVYSKIVYPDNEIFDVLHADDIVLKNGKQPVNSDRKG
jgi:Bacterial protein of unknown function (DUF961).